MLAARNGHLCMAGGGMEGVVCFLFAVAGRRFIDGLAF